MKAYTAKMQELDGIREGLDFEIQDLIEEMDTQASFDENYEHQQPKVKVEVEAQDGDQDSEDKPEPTKMEILVQKLVDR